MCCSDEDGAKFYILLAAQVAVCERTAKLQPKRGSRYFREILDTLRKCPTIYDIYIGNRQITLLLFSMFFKAMDITLGNTPG